MEESKKFVVTIHMTSGIEDMDEAVLKHFVRSVIEEEVFLGEIVCTGFEVVRIDATEVDEFNKP